MDCGYRIEDDRGAHGQDYEQSSKRRLPDRKMGGKGRKRRGKKERKRKKRKGERKDSYSRIPIAEQEKIMSHVHSDKCLRIYIEKGKVS
mgnify:CR=1 FL=1